MCRPAASCRRSPRTESRRSWSMMPPVYSCRSIRTFAMDRIARIQSLGRQRGRVIECLGGNSRLVRGAYFDPAADIDILDAYRAYVARMSASLEPLNMALLAAGRLLTGDLTAADVI